MDGQNQENLKELFERFFDSEQSRQAEEDIRKAEQILHKNPAPKPNEKLTTGIKADMAVALQHRKTKTFKRIIYKATAVAAMIIILAVISISFEKHNGGPVKVSYASIIPMAIWESDRLADDDTDLAILTAEIEEAEDDALALQLGENNGDGETAVTELETELIEIDSDFWKG